LLDPPFSRRSSRTSCRMEGSGPLRELRNCSLSPFPIQVSDLYLSPFFLVLCGEMSFFPSSSPEKLLFSHCEGDPSFFPGGLSHYFLSSGTWNKSPFHHDGELLFSFRLPRKRLFSPSRTVLSPQLPFSAYEGPVATYIRTAFPRAIAPVCLFPFPLFGTTQTHLFLFLRFPAAPFPLLIQQPCPLRGGGFSFLFGQNAIWAVFSFM